eukprot:2359462-Karenia_brevis.AAC.1
MRGEPPNLVGDVPLAAWGAIRRIDDHADDVGNAMPLDEDQADPSNADGARDDPEVDSPVALGRPPTVAHLQRQLCLLMDN